MLGAGPPKTPLASTAPASGAATLTLSLTPCAATTSCSGFESDAGSRSRWRAMSSAPMARQPASRLSSSTLNWPLSGWTARTQSRCAAAASTSTVGVSALYSANLGSPSPSHSRSKRPMKSVSRDSHDARTAGQSALGMPNSSRSRSLRTTSSTASSSSECSSYAADSMRHAPSSLSR